MKNTNKKAVVAKIITTTAIFFIKKNDVMYVCFGKGFGSVIVYGYIDVD